jgi:hypothetical protein
MSTTPPTSTAERPGRAVRWATPIFGVAVGGVFCVASWTGGSPGAGLFMLGVMVVFSVVVLLLAKSSETVAGLLDRRDERISTIDLRATALTGLVLILGVLGGFAWEIAHGRSGSPYLGLGALAGVTYLGAVVVLRVQG